MQNGKYTKTRLNVHINILSQHFHSFDLLYLRTLIGHSNILVYGSEVKPGCKIIADGSNEDAVMTVDFGQGSCESGKTASLNEGSIFINGIEIVSFGSVFKDVIFLMTECNDEVSIVKTYTDASSIEVLGYGGDDDITVGAVHPAAPSLDLEIFANLIIDGGAGGADELIIRDLGSSASKSIGVYPTMLTDIIGGTNGTISYFAVENIDMLLGTTDTDVRVYFTPRDTSLSITTQGEYKKMTCTCRQQKVEILWDFFCLDPYHNKFSDTNLPLFQMYRWNGFCPD